MYLIRSSCPGEDGVVIVAVDKGQDIRQKPPLSISRQPGECHFKGVRSDMHSYTWSIIFKGIKETIFDRLQFCVASSLSKSEERSHISKGKLSSSLGTSLEPQCCSLTRKLHDVGMRYPTPVAIRKTASISW